MPCSDRLHFAARPQPDLPTPPFRVPLLCCRRAPRLSAPRAAAANAAGAGGGGRGGGRGDGPRQASLLRLLPLPLLLPGLHAASPRTPFTLLPALSRPAPLLSPTEDPWGLGPGDKTEAGMRRRLLELMREGGCRQPNEVLAAAKRLFEGGERWAPSAASVACLLPLRPSPPA